MGNNNEALGANSSQYNFATNQAQLFHEELNTAYNHATIVEAFSTKRAKDVSDEPKKNKEPCFIIGSGASLDMALPKLVNWKGGIICSTSHALSLMKFGIEPTYILALDPFCQWEEIEGVDWSKTKTKLITHPGVWPSLIANWPNEMLFYIENNGRSDSFYATTQKRMYSWREGDLRFPTFHYYIRTEVTLFACSPPAQLFMADRLGYGVCFLSGCDFALTNNKTRFTNWTVNKEGVWESHDNPFIPGKPAPVEVDRNDKKAVEPAKENMQLIFSNNGIPSYPIHIYYKKNFISAWRLAHKTVYTTDKGALVEIPYVELDEVIEKQGLGYEEQSVEFIDDASEKYLAGVGCFVVRTEQGNSFVEVGEKPADELYAYMQGLTKQYVCDTCKNKGIANDTLDHDGETCTVCKQGKMKHFVTIDVKANMDRFSAMIGYKLQPVPVGRIERLPPLPVATQLKENNYRNKKMNHLHKKNKKRGRC